MAIHDCAHTFEELAATVLPGHFARMQSALAEPRKMEEFGQPGIGVKAILKQLEIPADFSGCYLLQEGDRPVYVGISRRVVARLRQHVCGKSHLDASLAFRIAMTKHPEMTVEKLTRSDAMLDPLFGTSFSEAQAYLKSLDVAYIAIENPLELYVFEPYCALALGTEQWNLFKTH